MNNLRKKTPLEIGNLQVKMSFSLFVILLYMRTFLIKTLCSELGELVQLHLMAALGQCLKTGRRMLIRTGVN